MFPPPFVHALCIKHRRRSEIRESLFEAVDKDIFVLLVRRCVFPLFHTQKKERERERLSMVIDGRKGAIRRRMGGKRIVSSMVNIFFNRKNGFNRYFFITITMDA